MYFLPSSNGDKLPVQLGQSYILTYFLPTYFPPTCDGARPVQLGQPTLFTEVKESNLLAYMCSLQHTRSQLSLGKWGL